MCGFCLDNQLSASVNKFEASAVTVVDGEVEPVTNNDLVSDFGNSENSLTYSEGADAPASTATPYVIQVGDVINGTISYAGDQDWAAIDLVAGKLYQFDLVGSGGSALSDTYLRLYDAQGNLIAEDDDGGAGFFSSLNFGAAHSGRYYISAAGYGSRTGSYTFSSQEIAVPTASPLDALDWGGAAVPSTNVTVYFARAGQTFDGVRSDGWTQAQIDGAMAALNDLSIGTNLTFTVTNDSSAATFKFVTDRWVDDTYAYMNPPSELNPGVAVFNTYNMNLANLARGSLEYFVFQHEVGHGLGMAHPHDNGGGSPVMGGVSNSADMGYFNLNQGIYTMMSYNAGYAELYPEWPDAFGATVGPMAFDLALLQERYGVRQANTGDNTYYLPDTNGTGTYYTCIWDSGGNDTIAYTGSRNVTISLVAATLDYSPTGGGVLSSATGVRGGYTIANGVTIENATGGSGNDYLYGNSADNILNGGAGDDDLFGGDGADTFIGGAGVDWVFFSQSLSSYTFNFFVDYIEVVGAFVDTVYNDVETLSFFDTNRSFDQMIFDFSTLTSVETNGNVELAKAGSSYVIVAANGDKIKLQLDSVGWVKDYSLAGWQAIQVEANETGGYQVLWAHDDGQYVVWQTDADGNRISSAFVDPIDYEATFNVDLNNDSQLGYP
ncbi:M10 family metallopeptidase C-terminal domain-containing protein, partial [Roseibium sediminis]|uniref:M10 family metallopeptidase C-terminal domain-containing protein n=1 Tax=Roseibium sediminis TaxID=1775174 RepID=UPI00123C829F